MSLFLCIKLSAKQKPILMQCFSLPLSHTLSLPRFVSLFVSLSLSRSLCLPFSLYLPPLSITFSLSRPYTHTHTYKLKVVFVSENKTNDIRNKERWGN